MMAHIVWGQGQMNDMKDIVRVIQEDNKLIIVLFYS